MHNNKLPKQHQFSRRLWLNLTLLNSRFGWFALVDTRHTGNRHGKLSHWCRWQHQGLLSADSLSCVKSIRTFQSLFQSSFYLYASVFVSRQFTRHGERVVWRLVFLLTIFLDGHIYVPLIPTPSYVYNVFVTILYPYVSITKLIYMNIATDNTSDYMNMW